MADSTGDRKTPPAAANAPDRQRPLVAAIVGIDGCGKSSAFGGALAALARTVEVVGIAERVWSGAPDRPLNEVSDIPLGRSARLVGAVAKGLRQPNLYKNLKALELCERSRILEHVLRTDPPDVVLCDGAPLVNSAAWSAARYYREYLADDRQLRLLVDYLSGARTIPARDLPRTAARSWQLVAVNRLGAARMAVPDAVFLLRIDPDLAMRRIRARGKPLQAHETEAFLGVLAEAYERTCGVLERDGLCDIVRLRADRLSADEVVGAVAEACRRRSTERRQAA